MEDIELIFENDIHKASKINDLHERLLFWRQRMKDNGALLNIHIIRLNNNLMYHSENDTGKKYIEQIEFIKGLLHEQNFEDLRDWHNKNNNEILNLNNHIEYLEKRLQQITSIDNKLRFLEFELKRTNDFINNKFLFAATKNKDIGISEIINKKLDVANNYIYEINKRIAELTKPPKPDINLEAIFTDKKDLEKLVKLLIGKNFVTEKNGSYLWTGREDEKAKGRGLQLVALAEVCKPLYKLKKYNGKDLYEAWTKYFNYKYHENQFTPGQIKIHITDSYKRLFNFILHSFNI